MRRRVTEARVARLATVRPDGTPHVVPITFVLDGDLIFSAVDHKPKKTADLQRLKNLEANPVASVIVDHYDDDWSFLWWARADGSARVVQRGPVHERAVDRLVEKYAPYRTYRPTGAVLVVAIDRWSSWSANPAPGAGQ
ncbi:MAG: TIGR03668 family PPOX class F420-dependent oxidoreductase [Actinomycetota bacterium]